MIDLNEAVRRVVTAALEEDIGSGDATTDSIVSPSERGRATLTAHETLVLAGLPVFKLAFSLLNESVVFEDRYDEGARVPAGEVVCRLTGSLAQILKAERTALNFLQRMSGIATVTRRYVDRVGDRTTKIVDTRKTAPGLRMLDKYSVRMGGGFNHRFGLPDGILIKDNHIATAGSLSAAVARARRNAPHTLRVEVEVEDLEGLREAMDAGVDVVMLDNMPVPMMREAVALAGGKVLLEASGGITLDAVEEIAGTGVDFISSGALTHSVRAVNLSLDVVLLGDE